MKLNMNSKWEPGYHPFPEMNRFLNSYSRIHHQSVRKLSYTRSNYSFLGYICSVSDNNARIEEILLIFGDKYRSLINTIIEEECPKYYHDKRMMMNNKRNNRPSMLYNPRRWENSDR
ncbi:unnamed protein product [Adineta steineri]|uniref:Uncharacterized protein n=1 Tax=Adineta steineri TaxID=433720 RepID=A0A816D1H2_9BILA|nr:unnamed protein product [Adineta steineri]CAF1628480.1 unnamed protein product [Adineta steineri]